MCVIYIRLIISKRMCTRSQKDLHTQYFLQYKICGNIFRFRVLNIFGHSQSEVFSTFEVLIYCLGIKFGEVGVVNKYMSQ
jgi:hypothetical protein